MARPFSAYLSLLLLFLEFLFMVPFNILTWTFVFDRYLVRMTAINTVDFNGYEQLLYKGKVRGMSIYRVFLMLLKGAHLVEK